MKKPWLKAKTFCCQFWTLTAAPKIIFDISLFSNRIHDSNNGQQTYPSGLILGGRGISSISPGNDEFGTTLMYFRFTVVDKQDRVVLKYLKQDL